MHIGCARPDWTQSAGDSDDGNSTGRRPILYGWAKGAQRHWCSDRDQGDVWQIKKPARNDLHPTMKPAELAERAIRNSSRPGDVVLDAFGGSGTTLIAAEKAARCAPARTRPQVCGCDRAPLAGLDGRAGHPGIGLRSLR
ncbi:hypothethical protein [Ralstonia solanacearum PSI07]|nr:hypothethical protein [Ralstonia solanacearum PSI07]